MRSGLQAKLIRMAAALVVVALAGVLAGAGPLGSETGETPAEQGEVMTFALQYGLNRTDVASFDPVLGARLIRFGTVALSRGQYAEAKRFFWQAILVDPTSTLAWRNYDQAVLYTLAQRVERSPGLVGLEGLADEPGAVKTEEPEVEEGC